MFYSEKSYVSAYWLRPWKEQNTVKALCTVINAFFRWRKSIRSMCSNSWPGLTSWWRVKGERAQGSDTSEVANSLHNDKTEVKYTLTQLVLLSYLFFNTTYEVHFYSSNSQHINYKWEIAFQVSISNKKHSKHNRLRRLDLRERQKEPKSPWGLQ